VLFVSLQAIAEHIAQERDNAEREARDKETKVLSLSRELEEINEKVEELERGKRMLQSELDELANTQGTADKNVSFLNVFSFQTKF
jgi:myosin heavy chain 9/10/11/14